MLHDYQIVEKDHEIPIDLIQRSLETKVENFSYETKYIDMIGVEFEGGWEDYREGFKSDGSLDIDNLRGLGAEYVKELVSDPSTLFEIKEFLYELPDFVDSSCGMHIHVSFKNYSDVLRLAENEFHEYFIDEITSWTDTHLKDTSYYRRMNSRIAGNNQYCYSNFEAKKQIQERSTDRGRYVQLNFEALKKFGTVECRIHPQYNDLDLVKSAVLNLVEIYETFLHRNQHKKPFLYFDPIEIEGSIDIVEGENY